MPAIIWISVLLIAGSSVSSPGQSPGRSDALPQGLACVTLEDYLAAASSADSDQDGVSNLDDVCATVVRGSAAAGCR